MEKENLLKNIDKIHTTKMGIDMIKKHLKLDTDNVVIYCKNVIIDNKTDIVRKSKNYYISNYKCIITVNAYSYTIITAHKLN